MSSSPRSDFAVRVSKDLPVHLRGRNIRRFWAPAWLAGLVGYGSAVVAAIVLSSELGGDADPLTIERLGHLIPALMSIGVALIFVAAALAIEGLLGSLHDASGDLQATTGSEVQTLRPTASEWAFIALILLGTLVSGGTVALHLFAAARAAEWSSGSLAEWATTLAGLRRLGIGIYLVGVALGLGAVISLLRFQAVRIRELADGGS